MQKKNPKKGSKNVHFRGGGMIFLRFSYDTYPNIVPVSVEETCIWFFLYIFLKFQYFINVPAPFLSKFRLELVIQKTIHEIKYIDTNKKNQIWFY